MAEDELVEIVPNMRMEPLNLLCVIYSPPFLVSLSLWFFRNMFGWQLFLTNFYGFDCRGIMVHSFLKWSPRCRFGWRLLWRREGNAQFDLLSGCPLVSFSYFVFLIVKEICISYCYALVLYNFIGSVILIPKYRKGYWKVVRVSLSKVDFVDVEKY